MIKLILLCIATERLRSFCWCCCFVYFDYCGTWCTVNSKCLLCICPTEDTPQTVTQSSQRPILKPCNHGNNKQIQEHLCFHDLNGNLILVLCCFSPACSLPFSQGTETPYRSYPSIPQICFLCSVCSKYTMLFCLAPLFKQAHSAASFHKGVFPPLCWIPPASESIRWHTCFFFLSFSLLCS